MANTDFRILFEFIAKTARFNQNIDKAESRIKNFSNKAKDLGRTLTTRVALPLAAAGGFAIKFAADMEESLNKVDVSFGESSQRVKDFADTTLREFGIAEGSALEMTALFGDMATGMGISQKAAADMSIELAGLAGDLASFKNIRIDVAQTALKSIFTGETESLKNLGIVMTQANLDAFALSQGMKRQVSEMSEAEKINLRLAFVLDRTKNAQGDFARTSDGAANQMRIFSESVKELAADLGQVLLPAFTSIVTKLNNVLNEFKNLSDSTKELIVGLGVGAGLSSVLLFITGSVIPPFIKGLKLIKTLFINLNPIVKGLTLSFTGFSVVIDEIAKATNVSFFETLVNSFKSLGNPISFASNQAKSLADGFKEVNEQVIENDGISDISDDFEEAAESSRKLVSSLSLSTNAYQNMQDAAIKAGEVLSEVPKKVNDSAKIMVDSMNIITPFIQGFANSISESFSKGTGSFADFGANMVDILGDLIIQMGLAAIAASELAKTFAIPIVGAAAGLAAVALGGVIKGIANQMRSSGVQSFADGGIVSGPTNALIGEYPGARSNPEVVAPLSKLKTMLGTSGGAMQGEFVLRGQDLVVALQRAERNRNRFK